MKIKKLLSYLSLVFVAVLVLVGCGQSSGGGETASSTDSGSSDSSSQEVNEESQDENVADLSFDELVEAADGSTVSFYGWGGDEALNQWLDNVYAPALKEKYNITLDRVPMDIEDVLNQLSNEKQAGETEGPIDMIWINGENFATARDNDFLYGPFTEQLPNFQDYVDEEDPEIKYDFGYPIEGYEAPYGKAQFVLIGDKEKMDQAPANAQEFLEYAQANPGQVTYPALPDFTGAAFVRNIIYEFVDPAEFQDMEADKEVVREAIAPAFDYLRDLNPHLWNEGQTFPQDQPQLNNMFMDGELALTMTYGAFDAAIGIENGEYPESAQTFIFDNGTIGNTNFIGIANNSTNKAGAMVAINEMLSPEMQLSKYEELRTIPVLDNDALDEDQQAAFDAVDPGPGTLPQDLLLENRLPEMPAHLVPIIEELWLEEVVGQTNE